MNHLLGQVDTFLDATARPSARAQDVGPLRAFLSNRPWPYYARPRPELDLSDPEAVSALHLRAAAEVLTGAGAPAAFEWIPERVPSMAAAIERAGLTWTTTPVLGRRAQPIRSGAAGALQPNVLEPDGRSVPQPRSANSPSARRTAHGGSSGPVPLIVTVCWQHDPPTPTITPVGGSPLGGT